MSTTKPITLCIESFDDEAGYVAWIDNDKFKGIVVHAGSVKATLTELLISLKVKIAYDYGISIGGIEQKIESLMQDYQNGKHSCKSQKQELNLMFA